MSELETSAAAGGGRSPALVGLTASRRLGPWRRNVGRQSRNVQMVISGGVPREIRMAGQSVAGPRRTRNPQLHRDAILLAAAQAFAERGYRDATLREIARRAGVTHGLVIRHFGSKEALFLASVPGTRDLAETASGPLETLPERIASGYVHRMEASDGNDPFIALVRSAVVDDSAAGRLLVAMQESSTAVYGELLGRDVAESVVPLLGAMLIGVTFSRYIVRAGALAEMSTDGLRDSLIRAIRGLLTCE